MQIGSTLSSPPHSYDWLPV